MTYPTCASECKKLGWIEYIASGDCFDLHISVAPGADTDGTFRAFCHDEQEMIRVNGWMFSLENA